MTTPERSPVTLRHLRAMKARHEPISMLTAYDASLARLIDEAGVECVLVGDSLGMVIQGRETTLPVTLDEMIYHAQAVARGLRHAFLIVDMPFMSYATAETALHNAARLMKEGGAHMVKLEGGAPQSDSVRRLAEQGIPVCAHLGLQPQSVHKLGGYRVQGRQDEDAERLLGDALTLEAAGADMLILECVPASLAARVRERLSIPVIGIGAGPDCDGQVLVLYDVLGISFSGRPRFSRDFMPESGGSLRGAIHAYVRAVREKSFPTAGESF